MWRILLHLNAIEERLSAKKAPGRVEMLETDVTSEYELSFCPIQFWHLDLPLIEHIVIQYSINGKSNKTL